MNLKDLSNEELLNEYFDSLYNYFVAGTEREFQKELRTELLSRLERWEQRDGVWRAKKELLENDLGKAFIDISNLKCCGNCLLGLKCSCPVDLEGNEHQYCDKWQSDKMTRKERAI